MMKYHFKSHLKNIVSIIVFAATIYGLSACQTIRVDNDYVPIGSMHKFEKQLVKGGDFWITTYQKTTNKSLPYVFYIEGDGRAFNGKYKVSNNPTPKSRLLIELAAMDDRANVVYIARPCQFTPMDLNPKCSTTAYWTSKRLSDDSVESINQVINQVNNGRPFSLIGYSGGGGIATLVAARNSLVKDIITISGNLDHKKFTQHHNVDPMVYSLNPIDYAKKINHIPQLHLSGGKDTIIPPFIADNYVQESDSSCVRQRIFPNKTHYKGWKDVWKYILDLPLVCHNN